MPGIAAKYVAKCFQPRQRLARSESWMIAIDVRSRMDFDEDDIGHCA